MESVFSLFRDRGPQAVGEEIRINGGKVEWHLDRRNTFATTGDGNTTGGFCSAAGSLAIGDLCKEVRVRILHAL